MSATRQLFRAVSAPLARCHALHPNQPAKIQAQRTFFSGKNFDPFSDLHKALKELERTSKDIQHKFTTWPTLTTQRGSSQPRSFGGQWIS